MRTADSGEDQNDLKDIYCEAAYYYTVGDFQKAAELFQSLVDLQHAPAAIYLSEMFFRGEGVPKDLDRGVQLLERAITFGNGLAAFNLAARYKNGADGVPVDLEKARHYFQLAKEMGCPYTFYL